jgi:hypothetical protein
MQIMQYCSYLCLLFMDVDVHKETQARRVSDDPIEDYCNIIADCGSKHCENEELAFCVHGTCVCMPSRPKYM